MLKLRKYSNELDLSKSSNMLDVKRKLLIGGPVFLFLKARTASAREYLLLPALSTVYTPTHHW